MPTFTSLGEIEVATHANPPTPALLKYSGTSVHGTLRGDVDRCSPFSGH